MEEYYRVVYRQFGSTEMRTHTVPAVDFFKWLNACIEGCRIASMKFEIVNIYDAQTDQPVLPGGLDHEINRAIVCR